jgi:uncharacterized membrane protein
MIPRALMMGTLGAALGAAVIGGAFFAFSSFVMKALGRLAPPEGIRAMQSINVVVINPVFLGVFVGTAVMCAALAVLSIRSWSEPGSGLRLAGCLAYVVGSFGVTMICNVPRNDALAALAADTADAAAYWARYLDQWTWWNHVRTVAGMVSSVLLVAAQLVGRSAP